MKKTTLPCMLALLAITHITNAAPETFTATITTDAGSSFPGIYITIEAVSAAGNLSSTGINSTGTTQVTLVNDAKYSLWGQYQQGKMRVMWPFGGGSFKFTANKSKPKIKIIGKLDKNNNTVIMTMAQS